jgi:hypothetical protein
MIHLKAFVSKDVMKAARQGDRLPMGSMAVKQCLKFAIPQPRYTTDY